MTAGHYKVRLSREEMDKLAAWMDLLIPFCGDYMEANAWSDGEVKYYQERLVTRKANDAIDLRNIQAMINDQ